MSIAGRQLGDGGRLIAIRLIQHPENNCAKMRPAAIEHHLGHDDL